MGSGSPASVISDAQAMALALEQARAAAAAGEVPVGAVLLHQGRVIARAHNACIGLCDPSAHAEIQVLRAAGQTLGNYRLDGCTLYVTLEPCPMCAGAMVHARLARLVYGASDPQNGAAGSSLNLLERPGLNHRVQVTAGVLASDCAQLLHGFFHTRRQPREAFLRPDALRTPTAALGNLPGPHAPRYTIGSALPALQGLQWSLVDTGPADAARSWLCLHGQGGWSHGLRQLGLVWQAAGHRVLAPDLIGFGASDKPKKSSFHRFHWHRDRLLELLELLELQRAVLVLQGSALPLGLALLQAAPQRFVGVLGLAAFWPEPGTLLPHGRAQLRSLSATEQTVLKAPFPDHGHAAALRATHLWQADASEAAELRGFMRTFWQHSGAPACVRVQTQAEHAAGDGPLSPKAPWPTACTTWLVTGTALSLPERHGQALAQRSLAFFADR